MNELIQNDRIPVYITTPMGDNIPVINADTTASGIPSKSIEEKMQQLVPFYSNTHSNAYMGNHMSEMIKDVRKTVAKEFHINRDKYDILFTGNGCTMCVKQILHILGVYEHPNDFVILISENEHHAVHLGCLQALQEQNCIFNYNQLHKINKGSVNDLIVIPTIRGTNQINAAYLEDVLKSLTKSKKQIICFFNHGSNVTGSIQDQYNINFICKSIIPNIIMCWDYACSFPYVDIYMEDDNTDVIVCSPHKCWGGNGTTGLLVYKKNLHKASYPFVLAGGITQYICDKEQVLSFNQENLESAGSPNGLGILRLKEVLIKRRKMLKYIQSRNKQLTEYLYNFIANECNNFQILDLIDYKSSVNNHKQLLNDRLPISNILLNDRLPISNSLLDNRLPIVSIYSKQGIHYNLLCAVLSDFFGIMTRGGLSCCSLLYQKYLPCCASSKYRDIALSNILEGKGMPCNYGGLRISLNYFMTDDEVVYICQCLKHINDHIDKYKQFYKYNPDTNHYDLI